MKLPILLTLFFIFFILPFSAHAEIFQWKDENGKIHFSDTPPASQEAESREFESNYDSDSRADEERDDQLNTNEKLGTKNGKKERTKAERYLDEYNKKVRDDKQSKAQQEYEKKAEESRAKRCHHLKEEINSFKRKMAGAARSNVNNYGNFNSKIFELEKEYARECK